MDGHDVDKFVGGWPSSQAPTDVSTTDFTACLLYEVVLGDEAARNWKTWPHKKATFVRLASTEATICQTDLIRADFPLNE